MLKDEDIIGHEDLDEEDADEAAIAVPDKWAKLEADLKKIKDKTAQGDEIQTLRQTLEAGDDGKDKVSGLSKKEQKKMRKAFKELDKLERDNFVADLQKKDQAATEQKSMGTIVEN